MVLSLGLRRVHRKVHGSGRPPSLLRSRALSHFRVTEHIPPTQHTRHWPRGTEVGYENALKLAVKQYVPLTNLDPQPGDVTFVAAHANGFPKEMYEPMFDDLFEKLSRLGRRIRAVWIADIAHQGQSGILNEDALGNDRTSGIEYICDS